MINELKTGQDIKIDGETYTIKEIKRNKKDIIVTKQTFSNPIYHVEQNEIGTFKIIENYNNKSVHWKLRK